MVVGFDLDGVIFKPVLPFYGLIKKFNLDFLVYKLRRITSIKNTFYHSIKINRSVAQILKQLESYHKIVIISGHSEKYREEVRNCLLKNGISFDALLLRPDKSDYFNFKLKKVIETKCDFYIDDRKDLVNYLQRRLNGICRIIYYKNSSSLTELNLLIT